VGGFYLAAAEVQRHVTEIRVAAESEEQRSADREVTGSPGHQTAAQEK